MRDAMTSRAQAREVGDVCHPNATVQREEMVAVDYVLRTNREAKPAGLARVAVLLPPLSNDGGVPPTECDRPILLETFVDGVIIYRREGLPCESFHDCAGRVWKERPTLPRSNALPQPCLLAELEFEFPNGQGHRPEGTEVKVEAIGVLGGLQPSVGLTTASCPGDVPHGRTVRKQEQLPTLKAGLRNPALRKQEAALSEFGCRSLKEPMDVAQAGELARTQLDQSHDQPLPLRHFNALSGQRLRVVRA
jgi:hypothetical protein